MVLSGDNTPSVTAAVSAGTGGPRLLDVAAVLHLPFWGICLAAQGPIPKAGRARARLRMSVAEEPGLALPPVFLLTAARSGSTLLRFILDSHPDLACPPELDIAVGCAYLARSWTVLGRAVASRPGAPAAGPADGGPVLPAEGRAALRGTADAVLGHYLRSTGKRQVCDKSLSTVYYAALMAEIYPEAKFICLYRHGMDVIASYVSAMPWGLSQPAVPQPEFLPVHGYIARNPGNSVAAVAEYWADCTQRAARFEGENPGRCHRVRYEDLVEDPEGVTAGVLSFLGVAQVPGITGDCFRVSHDQGPSDSKIWSTRQVRKDSVGSGVAVPAARLAGRARADVNGMLSVLGYRIVDDQWNDPGDRRDPRARP
jgi:protein-tyrosine sulfotransferase